MIREENRDVCSECCVLGSGEMAMLGNYSGAPVTYIKQDESVLNPETAEFKCNGRGNSAKGIVTLPLR